MVCSSSRADMDRYSLKWMRRAAGVFRSKLAVADVAARVRVVGGADSYSLQSSRYRGCSLEMIELSSEARLDDSCAVILDR